MLSCCVLSAAVSPAFSWSSWRHAADAMVQDNTFHPTGLQLRAAHMTECTQECECGHSECVQV